MQYVQADIRELRWDWIWVNPASQAMKGSYAASKSAAWAMTNGVRIELASRGTLVVGVHAGYIDTEMVADVKAPKIAPAEVAR